MMRILARIALVLVLSLVAACGGGNMRAKGIPSQFGDSAPHAWRGKTPARYDVHGIDVSRWQGTIDWGSVARGGVSFAYIKATEGGDVVDPMFLTNWAGAGRAGLPRGAYHFYYLCRPAAEQAQYFIANVPRSPGALPPVLDVEWNHASRTCRTRPSPAVMRSEILTFQRIVGAYYGQRPVIYTTVDFYHDNGLGALRGEEFWLRSVADHPKRKYPGQSWTFWQYSGTGTARGISGNVDLNAFAGSRSAWASWVARRGI